MVHLHNTIFAANLRCNWKFFAALNTCEMETIKENEIVLYQPNETIRLEVRVEKETVRLSQAQMADFFGTGRLAITKHIKNIYECGELQKEATCSILELVRLEGKSFQTQRHPIVMQPVLTFLVVWHDRKNCIPELACVLWIFQVR